MGNTWRLGRHIFLRDKTMQKIESPSNPKLKVWQDCLTNAGIKKHGLAVVGGRKVVSEIAKSQMHPGKPTSNSAYPAVTILLCDEHDPHLLPPTGSLPVFVLRKDLFKELDTSGTHFPLAVLHAPEIPTGDLAQAANGLELILPLSDPQNLGAAIRTASAFFISKIFITAESANPYLPKVSLASAGTNFQMQYFRLSDLKNVAWDKNPSPIAALHMDGTAIHKFKFEKNMRLLVGSEGSGLPDNWREKGSQLISIPMNPNVESLNAVAAASIAMYAHRVACSLS
jgi:TrmH family RNA methyltransferase